MKLSAGPSVPFWIKYYQNVQKVKAKMKKIIHVRLPADVNPDALLTLQKASQLSGIPIRMLYEWRRQPWRGMRVYRIGRRIFVKADEFIRWINATIEPV